MELVQPPLLEFLDHHDPILAYCYTPSKKGIESRSEAARA